ncbi:MAG: hypothetical protein ACYDAC_00620 [Candidatus Dormibacteria bacterium]
MSAVIVAVYVLVGLSVVAAGAYIAIAGLDRYRSSGRVHPAVLQPTPEVFVDPETGRRMRVWFDPATGTREYREE